MSKADISTTPILARRHCCSDRIHSNPDARRRHLYAAHLILETGGDAKETMGWIDAFLGTIADAAAKGAA